MRLNRKQLIWGAAGIVFALGSIKIHHTVKVELANWPAVTDRLGDIQVGSKSPDFSAADLKGRQVVLSEMRDRKAVVVDFWATWCAPCLRSMPKLQELHEEFEERQVEVVAVNLGEDLETIERFLRRKEYTFRVVADKDEAIGNRFGVNAIPAQLVVNADGLVEWIQIGYDQSKESELRQLLERLTQ